MHANPSTEYGQSGRILFYALGVVVLLGMAAVAVYQYYSSPQHEPEWKAQAMIEDMRRRGGIVAYGSIDAFPQDDEVVISDLSVTVPPGLIYTVEHMVVREYKMRGDLPEHVDMSLENMTIDLKQGLLAQILDSSELGLDSVSADMDVDYGIDMETGLLTVDELNVSAHDLFDLSYTFAVGGMPTDEVAMREMDPLQLVIHGGEIVYTDHSLVQRILDYSAREADTDPETVRAELLAELDQAIEEAGAQQGHGMVAFLEGIKEFMEDPGTIRITVAPPEPLRLSELENVRDEFEAFDRLHITVDVD